MARNSGDNSPSATTSRTRSWQSHGGDDEEPARPPKRARVALACQRCKLRKQKCDGVHPACSKCRSLHVQCEYIIPDKPMPFGKNHYIRSLEQRVAELESYLAEKGIPEPGSDHWQYSLPQPSQRTPESRRGSREEPPLQWPTAEKVPGDAETENESEEFDAPEMRTGFHSMVGILKDLSLDANGGYIGASSHITMGKLVGYLIKERQVLDDSLMSGNPISPPSTVISDVEEDACEVSLRHIPSEIADKMIEGYIKHISTRWPVLYSPYIRELNQRRSSINDVYEHHILHLVYATGGRFLETAGDGHPAFQPELHYSAALKSLDEVMQYRDVRSVCALTLLAVYGLRAPGGPGAWTYSRLAMMNAIDLGLHRQPPSPKQPSLDYEMRKRIFWACYAFDRQISIPIGRPFALSDRDIDVPLPLDVDEAVSEETLLELATKEDLMAPRMSSTTLSSFLHIVRLRQIESEIQQTVYRVDGSTDVPDSQIDYFLAKLAKWKSQIPLDAKRKTDVDGEAFDGYDYYMVFYYKCLRFLLYPQISKRQANLKYIKACAAACVGVCQTYKRLHQTMHVGYSMMSLQTVFLAGLTLIYCTWISPKEIFNPSTNNDIAACSIVLFVMAERMQAAVKYRNAFEVVRQKVIDQIASGKHPKPRQAVGGLMLDLQSAINACTENEESIEQFSQIVNRMDDGDLEEEGFPRKHVMIPRLLPLESLPATYETPQPLEYQYGGLFDNQLPGVDLGDFDFLGDSMNFSSVLSGDGYINSGDNFGASI